MSEQEVATAEPITPAQEAEPTPAPASEVTSAPTEAEPAISTPAQESSEEPSTQISAPPTETSSTEFSIHTLQPGQKLTGKVKNIATFGAFVDIGLPQDGLVHISELARKKVDNVTDVVSVGQEVEVWVKRVDQQRGRISLTMIKPISLRLKEIEEGVDLEGVVTRLESYGAFVDIGSVRDGLVHISQITHEYIKHPQDALAVGDLVKVKVLKVNRKKRQIDLSIKALLPLPELPAKPVEEDPKQAEAETKPKTRAEARPQEVKMAESRAKVVEQAEEPAESDEESMPTAMAMAYAAMQSRSQSSKGDKGAGKGSSKQRKELDDLLTRTLASTNK
jgi:transcriptional accessory protein Tex/SPT6